MKNEKNIELHLNDLGRFIPSISADTLSEDFFISRPSKGSEMSVLKHPFRFDGYFAYFCNKGKFRVEINLREFEITQGTLLLYVPGNMISLTDTQEVENSEFVFLAVTRKILQNAKVDFSKLYDEAMSVLLNPCIKLEQNEVDICRSYYYLSEKLILAAQPTLEDTLIDLGSSLFHYLGSLWSDRITREHDLPNGTIRSKIMFERFLKLVSEHHGTQREVGFYARELNISPKYLSQLICKTSGRSAPDWISSFVILEAKNYLKYSDLDVKEIAYKLNFSSTPVFFRYFKTHTGLTPLEYRKS